MERDLHIRASTRPLEIVRRRPVDTDFTKEQAHYSLYFDVIVTSNCR